MKTAAIYARVSSDKQKAANTIASQTAALIAFAAAQDCTVPAEWISEDEGYSGASLIRPGLERVRDLAAEGQLDAVLVYAPDRLSRRYAYQILLIEEFARAGVETRFIRSPRATTAEDQLLLPFQGMIAEYERAPILERSRCGKRHRPRQRQGSVLSGAPFGYRHVRQNEQSAAYDEINEMEAPVVRWVYERYTVDGSASVRSPAGSMSSGSRRASKPVAGNARRSGPCCATPPIKAPLVKAPLALARHRPCHGTTAPHHPTVAPARRHRLAQQRTP